MKNPEILAAGPITPVYNFKSFDALYFKGIFRRPVESDLQTHTLQRVHDGLHETFTHEEIHAMFRDPDEPMEYRPDYYSKKGSRAAARPRAYLGDLDEKRQEQSLFQTRVCEIFARREREESGFTRSDKVMKKTLPEIWDEIADKGTKRKNYLTDKVKPIPHPRTVRNWLRKYESDASALNQVKKWGRNQKNTYYTAEECVVLQQYIEFYLANPTSTKAEAHALMVEKIKEINAGILLANEQNEERGNPVASLPELRTPSLKTFSERINDLPAAFLAYARLGKAAADREYAAARDGLKVFRPLQRGEMDEWRVDLQVLLVLAGVWQKMSKKQRTKVARIRLWMTAIIDVATRCLLGFRVHKQAPSVMTSIATLEMTAIVKTSIAKLYGCTSTWEYCGTLEEVATDSATWYSSQPFRVTVNDLGATLLLPPAGAASARGTIERFFRTTAEHAFQYFSGLTGNSVEAKGDSDPEVEASVTFEEVAAILTRYFVDVYHNTPHEGLGGETPRNAWNRLAKHGITPPPSPAQRRHIFGVNVQRVVGKQGIRFLGVYFQSVELQALRRRWKDGHLALIRVDRQNLGSISVWTGEGWLTVPAIDEEFEGMSMWAWTAICAELKAINATEAKLSRPTVRKAKEDARKRAEVLRMEADLDNPVSTEAAYLEWEKKLDLKLRITARESSVPQDFMSTGQLAEDFYRTIGIELPVGENAWRDASEHTGEPDVKETVPAPETPAIGLSNSVFDR
ncbi:Mu transposase C-terminal domain-containing protein [Shinella curvata]|uniref:Mu transposase C-terminal domain-containing protein n=1 Tax=Shinella curvata TaxID=1817964 RepID=A0ABT8XMK3_9HYPH|nr:Mu transposase C-terminal domain-containing protein [Shinella curvata]MCJ8057190.1 Mu transposase C-terminal domain-containing protein [Shinella curvata]MDO6124963.1 Mu transposase C-terminal domain-containing protein [Shinella curvata]